jgi:phage N-6-adenine-methyltransferase
MSMAVHYSSATDLWATPQEFFDRLHAEFGFDLDVCATPENAKCDRYFTTETDGLAQDWAGTCWMNPPYGRVISHWMRKAWESAQAGATVVCLVPSRTDTRWWHDYAMRGEIRYVKGRLRFGGAVNPAPFPCAVVIFRPSAEAEAA